MIKSKLTPVTATETTYPCLFRGRSSKAIVSFSEDKIGVVVSDPRNVYTNRADGTPHFSNNWEMDMFEPIQEKKEDPKDIEFPCIMQAEDGDVVMLTGINVLDPELVCGITLHKGHNDPSTNEEIGVSANDWPLDQFEPFKGSVNLSTQDPKAISEELRDLPEILKAICYIDICSSVNRACDRNNCKTCAFDSETKLAQIADELDELIKSSL